MLTLFLAIPFGPWPATVDWRLMVGFLVETVYFIALSSYLRQDDLRTWPASPNKELTAEADTPYHYPDNDYSDATNPDLLALAQGQLVTISCEYIVVQRLEGYRAQRILEEQPGRPGRRFRLVIDPSSYDCPVAVFGGLEDLGIFELRQATVVESDRLRQLRQTMQQSHA